MTAPGDHTETLWLAVRFSDLDVAGHVNNVAWLRFVHLGVSQLLASRLPLANRAEAGAPVWRWVEAHYRRTVQAVGTPIVVRASSVEQAEGLLVAAGVGSVGLDGTVVDCVAAEVFVGPSLSPTPEVVSGQFGAGPPPALTSRWPWSMVVPVRPPDRAEGGALSPVAAADLLQEARHGALSGWRNGIRGRLVVARVGLDLGPAWVGDEIRLDTCCARVGRASFDLATRGVDPVTGATVVQSTARIARLMTDTDRSATPWSEAERALLGQLRTGAGSG
ncbi:hypothetical protein [Micromonospora sp. NPDC047730]|uniref:hypothetical protein n=1 Tax=Micromonospora sp. NPDC047730 TaxID=3364253 RepID=UPI00372018A0